MDVVFADSGARRSAARALLLLAAVGLALLGPAACRTPAGGGAGGVTTEALRPPVVPPSPDLSNPTSAVRSYIEWTNLSYRMANSELSTRVADPWENVRVDSYVQLNRQQNRAIEQTLTAFEVRSLTTKDGTATLAAKERWRYRYLSLDTKRYTSPEYTVRYDTTYTVARQRDDGRWLVSRVQAKALDPVR